LKERSFGNKNDFKGVIPKTTLYQTFEKPIIPKKFAVKITIKVEKGPFSKKPVNTYSSLKNFIVPGKPEYKTQPNKIIIPRFGVMCNIPLISTIFLEL